MIRHSELVRYVGTKLLKQEKVKTYFINSFPYSADVKPTVYKNWFEFV